MRDNNLFFRNTTASLTATETSSGLAINGTPAGGLAVVIDVPKKDVGDTVQFKLQHSTDDLTYTDLGVFETIASVTATVSTPTKLVRRFHTRNKYVRLLSTVAGTSPDFGAVKAYIGDEDVWHNAKLGQNVTSNP